MERVRVGTLDVSRVSFGCAAIGGFDYGAVEDAQSLDAVRAALDAGINLFDTADVYGFGHAETILSRGLADERHGVVIATKGGVRWDDSGRTRRDLSRASLSAALDDSLRRLRVECIGLYQVHWPDERTPLGEVGETLAHFVQSGKIRQAGVCNMSFDAFAAVNGGYRLAALQVPYSCADRRHAGTMAGVHRTFATPALVYNVLAQGFFTGKYSAATRFSGTDLRQRSVLFQGDEAARNERVLQRLKEIAARRGATPGQVAIRWALHNPAVASAIVGAKTAAQVVENASAAGLALDEEDYMLINAEIGRPAAAGTRPGCE